MPIGNVPYTTHLPVNIVLQGSQAMSGASSQVVTLAQAFTTIDSFDIYFSDNATNFVPGNIGVVKLSTSSIKFQTVDGSTSTQTINWAVIGF